MIDPHIIRGGCNKRLEELKEQGKQGSKEYKEVVEMRDTADRLIREKEVSGG